MSNRSSPEPRLLRRVFYDTLHRGPTPREMQTLGRVPLDRTLVHLCGRPEMAEQWIEQELYYFLLLDQFRPKAESLQRLVGRFAEGRASVRDVSAEILLSSGFSLRNPGNDTFVSVLLEQCLGLEVQARANRDLLAAGKAIYDGATEDFFGEEARSQADLVRIVLRQREFTANTVDRHYQRIFGEPLRTADRRGRLSEDERATAWIDRVHADWDEFLPLLREWLGSEGYAEGVNTPRPKSDRQFVRSIFTDLLDRQPDYQELRNVRNALQSMADATPLRAVVATVLLGAEDADLPVVEKGSERAFVATCFDRYLGRAPTDQERQTFTSALSSGRADGRHVIRTLVTSAEYQTY